MRKKILVRGPVLTRSGYGEHVRFVLRALREQEEELDLYLISTNWGKTGWLFDTDEERVWIDNLLQKTLMYTSQQGTFDASIQVTIPNEWEKLAPINIGVTAGIETTMVSPQWIDKSHAVDKIIVPSKHSKDVYEATSYVLQDKVTKEVTEENWKCKTPINVVSYPVRNFTPTDIDLDLQTDFNFLAVAQWGPRKNLDNTIKWFVEEFYDQEVGLVVKTNLAANSTIDRNHVERRLKNLLTQTGAPERKCKVYLLHGDMTNEEMAGLYQHPKINALVTLTHGEGFGLPIFEAVYNELPVIAPDWSGHVDFLYCPSTKKSDKGKMKHHFAKVDHTLDIVQKQAVWDTVVQADSQWCYPSPGSYKMKMRDMFKDYGRFKKQAKTLAKWVQKEFSQDKMYDAMVRSVKESL